MHRNKIMRCPIALIVIAPLLAAGLIWADEPARTGRHLRTFLPPLHHRGTPPPGPPRAIPQTHQSAGFPLCLAAHDSPSNTPHYVGYYVGGGSGSRHHGEPRTPIEGTWGWDYSGVVPRRVNLLWLHHRHGPDVPWLYRTDNYIKFTQTFDLAEAR